MTAFSAHPATFVPARRWLARLGLLLDEPAQRRRLYWWLAIVLYCVAWALVIARAHVKHTTLDFALSDATGYYVYLPSLLIDGDLDFANQLTDQYGQAIPAGFDIALQKNRWPTGIALTLLPAFLVAHGLTSALHAITGAAWCVPNGYTPIYFLCCVGWAMTIGVIGMCCADRLVTERFSLPGRIAAAAVLTAWLGTNAIWYFLREPLVAHMIGAAWVSIAVYLVHRIDGGGAWSERAGWTQAQADRFTAKAGAGGSAVALLVFAVSMALACRLTNAFLLPVVLYAVWVMLRRGMIRPVLRWLPVCLLALGPLVVQMMVMRAITGQAAPTSLQEIGYRPRERFYWTEPALLRILISSHHGLFFSTPALLIAAWGLFRFAREGFFVPAHSAADAVDLGHEFADRGESTIHPGCQPAPQAGPVLTRSGLIASKARRDWLVPALLAGAGLLWYVNAAWYAWWFGHSIGNRAFIELSVLFVIGFGFAYQHLARVARLCRRLVLGFLALSVLFNYTIIGLKLIDRIEGDEILIPAEKRLFTGRWERI